MKRQKSPLSPPWLIGHRGAAGLALENTRQSIDAGRAAGTKAVEIDVRQSQDGHLVVVHDQTTRRISRQSLPVNKTSWSTLQQLELLNGDHLLDLSAACRAAEGTKLFIDMKGQGWAPALAQALPGKTKVSILTVDYFYILSFNYKDLKHLQQLRPDLPLYALTAARPLHACRVAHQAGWRGVDMHWAVLNPLSYWLARHFELDIIVYTVNSVWLAKWITKLYPAVKLTTDYPNKLQNLHL